MAKPFTVFDRVKLLTDLAFGSLADTAKYVRIKGPSSAPAANRAYTLPDVLADADFVMTAGTQTIAGAKTFSTAPVFSTSLLKASVGNNLKRLRSTVRLAPETGACANTTVYRGVIAFGRAGTVTAINYGSKVATSSGTNVITVQKASFGGSTMLSTASVSINAVTANAATVGVLTATGADLVLTATEIIACEYNAGTQGAAAEQVFVSVEFEPDDY